MPDDPDLLSDHSQLRRGDHARLTFVTVVYEDELNLMILQARSIFKFMEPSMLHRILIIVNGANQRAVAEFIKMNVLPEYGALVSKVDLFSSGGVVPGIPENVGWFTQQVLKLAIADFVTTDYYVSLDTKNHFVRHASLSSFFWDDGRARYEPQSHLGSLMEAYLLNSLAFFGNHTAAWQNNSWPTTTPFVFHTAATRLLRQEVQRRGETFNSLLVQFETPCSEFFLYYSFLVMIGAVEKLYKPDRSRCVCVWDHVVGDSQKFEDALASIESDEENIVFSIHREAFRYSTKIQRQRIGRVWARFGLVSDDDDADRLLRYPAVAGAASC
jgi:Family of unknown function (DUF6492)